MTEDAILVEGLSKRFYRYHGARPWTFQELFLRGASWYRKRYEFWALRDISFRLAPGRTAGVIGRNGAGKSTLLRLVGGVGKADRGRIVTRGRIGALIDLGAGFHPDLSGRENVFINGVISGLTHKEVAKNFDSIVAFAELEEFIDSPLRIYSTGMQMRLAFAIAVHIQPSILLIDEILAVGDYAFQNKCLERIAQFKAQGCTILLVSHNTNLVSRFCDEVLWLEAGELKAYGEAEQVVGQYLAEMGARTRARTPDVPGVQITPTGVELRLNENRFGSLEVEIEAVNFYNTRGEPTRELESGEGVVIEIAYIAPQPIAAPIFGVTITRPDGLVCWDSSTQHDLLPTSRLQGKGKVILHLERLDLVEGQYYVDVGIYQHDWEYSYDYHWHVYPLKIHSHESQKGILSPPHRWEFKDKDY